MQSGAIGIATAGEVGHDTSDTRLRTLFEAHHQRLYRLARRMTRSSDDANDLVQETFLRAAQALSSVPSGIGPEEAWLVRVLINVCRDGWRKRAIRRRLDEQHLDAVRGWAPPSPETAFIARTLVWQALQNLPPRRRAAVVLYELEGLGVDDIARLLHVSAVTVRWHLSRGRRQLARVLGAKGDP